ncbi:MerR family transcriptional regulator [Lachnospiraceae bacterium 54-53]
MNELFSIGEVSRLFHIDVRLLRHYDKISLLKPEYLNEKNGYRYYSTRQFEALNTIRYLRSLNMPLSKIRDFFEGRDDRKMLELLKEKKRQVEEEQERLARIERKINSRILQLEDTFLTEYDVIKERRLADRVAAVLRKEISVADDLEHPIRELEQSNGLSSVMFLGKVGVSISAEDLTNRKFNRFSAIFVVMEPEDDQGDRATCLAGGTYLTMRFRGTHRDAGPAYLKMLQYMEQKGYALNGDSIEFALVDYGLTSDPSKFTTEIQIPYKNY